VEPVLVMRRFPKEDELAEIAERGALDDALADDLGAAVAAYHAKAPVRDEDGAALIGEILDELDAAFAARTAALGPERVAAFSDRARAAWRQVAPLLTGRTRAGFVRRGHSDLHLGNIVMLEGRPVPFDALEFDERLGTCDVLYDLAFLIMDLLHRGLPSQANVAFNRYLHETRDEAGLSAFPLFLAVRAGIRAMVEAQTAEARRAEVPQAARTYLDEAAAFLAPARPCLVAVGGRSGTGKTTLARALAPGLGVAPGALHLRSDTERKALKGVAPLTPLPEDAYRPEVTAEVYIRLRDRAARGLAAGQSVIVDATFLDTAERAALEAVAREAGVPFHGLWLEAAERVLVDRVTARARDASDADAQVVRAQPEAGPDGWTPIPAGDSPERTLAAARAALRGG
jgi:predicted kinase